MAGTAEQLSGAGWRVGQGFDAHRFAVGSTGPLRLALLEWPGEPALEGHSDGDVVAHALVDALASAAALGDIGELFGVDRPEHQGQSSARFLAETIAKVRRAGFAVENAAVQLIGNHPRLAGRRWEAARGIGQILGAPVSLSATTTDRMGFTGRGEGLAALAVCLLRPAAPATPATPAVTSNVSA